LRKLPPFGDPVLPFELFADSTIGVKEDKDAFNALDDHDGNRLEANCEATTFPLRKESLVLDPNLILGLKVLGIDRLRASRPSKTQGGTTGAC